MAVRIAKKRREEPKPEKQVPVPVASGDIEGKFIQIFKKHVPDVLQDVAFQKEDGKFKHAWTQICYTMFKDNFGLAQNLDTLLTRAEVDLTKATDLLETFGGIGKAEELRKNLAQLKTLHKNYAEGMFTHGINRQKEKGLDTATEKHGKEEVNLRNGSVVRSSKVCGYKYQT